LKAFSIFDANGIIVFSKNISLKASTFQTLTPSHNQSNAFGTPNIANISSLVNSLCATKSNSFCQTFKFSYLNQLSRTANF
jgi:hypothetical protein